MLCDSRQRLFNICSFIVSFNLNNCQWFYWNDKLLCATDIGHTIRSTSSSIQSRQMFYSCVHFFFFDLNKNFGFIVVKKYYDYYVPIKKFWAIWMDKLHLASFCFWKNNAMPYLFIIHNSYDLLMKNIIKVSVKWASFLQ